jgi:predicted nucleic acid-binding protein
VITAVDTNVLLDVLGGDRTFGPASLAALRAASLDGALIASEVVWAETAAGYDDAEDAATALDELRVRLVPTGVPAALVAGRAWRGYLRTGGKRTRVIADFLVGAHASVHADRLLTRDRRFYGSGFADLQILDPTAG